MLFLLEEKAIRRSNLKLTEMELKHLDVIVRAIPSEVLQTYKLIEGSKKCFVVRSLQLIRKNFKKVNKT